MRKAFICNDPKRPLEYRVIVKKGGVRIEDRTFVGETARDAVNRTLQWLESSGITDRIVCDPRHYDPDTI